MTGKIEQLVSLFEQPKKKKTNKIFQDSLTSLRIELRDLSINFGSNLEIIGCQKAVKVVQYKFSFSFLVKQNNRLKLEISLI